MSFFAHEVKEIFPGFSIYSHFVTYNGLLSRASNLSKGTSMVINVHIFGKD